MRNVVIFDEYHEGDIRPAAALERYIELVGSDVRSMMAAAALRDVNCPGCESGSRTPAFSRFDCEYSECDDCGSLYMTPRPDDAAIRAFYVDSSARRFWRDELATPVSHARVDKVLKPRTAWVADSAAEHIKGDAHLAELRAIDGAFIRELSATGAVDSARIVEPWFEHAAGAAAGGDINAVALFEAVDRASDVDALLGSARKMLKPGGICLLTSILASGFDVQVLWNRAANIFPPDRLNVLTVEGMRALVERHGFEIIEFSTPGVLDVDIVQRVTAESPDAPIPRLVRYLLYRRAPELRGNLQEFLQANLLSSFGRVLMRRR